MRSEVILHIHDRKGTAKVEPTPGRNYKYDNIKAFLIFCVVFAHLVNLFSGPAAEVLYRTIYIFHMPAFIFVTGRFARFEPRKLLERQLLPYAFFQVLYITWDHLILGEPWALQFTTPRWILWYLLASAFWHLLLPLVKTERRRRMALTLALSLALALAAGYCQGLGFYLSLSRVVVFLPFFLLGLYWRTLEPRVPPGRALRTAGIAAGLLAAGLSLALLRQAVSRGLLYGALSYADCGCGPELRLLHTLAAACWIGALVCLAPDRRIGAVSALGQNTLTVFLFHGLVIRVIAGRGLFFGASEGGNLAIALLLTLGLLAAFGNPWVGGLLRLPERTRETRRREP